MYHSRREFVQKIVLEGMTYYSSYRSVYSKEYYPVGFGENGACTYINFRDNGVEIAEDGDEVVHIWGEPRRLLRMGGSPFRNEVMTEELNKLAPRQPYIDVDTLLKPPGAHHLYIPLGLYGIEWQTQDIEGRLKALGLDLPETTGYTLLEKLKVPMAIFSPARFYILVGKNRHDVVVSHPHLLCKVLI